MRERITVTYEAFDGTVFISEEDCLRHEQSVRMAHPTQMFDLRQKPCAEFKDAMYVFIKDERDVDSIIAYCESYGYMTPYNQGNIDKNYRGLLIYNERFEEWETYDSMVKMITSIKDFMVEHELYTPNQMAWINRICNDDIAVDDYFMDCESINCDTCPLHQGCCVVGNCKTYQQVVKAVCKYVD